MKYEYYNPNPKVRYRKDGTPMKWHKGDCTTRALAKALDLTWKETFKLQCDEAMNQCTESNSIDVCDAVLLANGFNKGKVSQEWIKRNHRRPTVDMMVEWANRELEHKKIVFECSSPSHLTTVENDTLYDVWDSSDQIVWRYWYK